MKKWILTIILCLFSCGCLEDMTAERLKALAGDVDKLNVHVDAYQDAVQDLAAKEAVPAELVTKIDKVAGEVDRIQDRIGKVAAAVANAEANSGDQLTDLLQVVRAGNEATAPWNPYSPLIDTVLLAATGVATWWARNRAKRAEVNRLKYEAHKVGAAKTMMKAEKDVAVELYDNIGAAREALGVK